MLITINNEIVSLMPTARWSRPEQLFGYLDEEERVSLEPLLGTELYAYLLQEYDRLLATYTDITATTVRPTGKAKQDARLAYADVTERIELIRSGRYRETFVAPEDGDRDVPLEDMQTIRLIRICQQIEFYKMLSHKSGLLAVSFNEGGGMNTVSADGYDPADDKRMERMVKDAYMSAGRAVDSLLLFLEADAKGERLFTELWQNADSFYLHKDLLFQTARVLNEYLDIKGERMKYVSLVRDIRFCQNTYLKPRIGSELLKSLLSFSNGDERPDASVADVIDELTDLLRISLAFYVESRRVTLEPSNEKLARRDSLADAQQALSTACSYIEQHIEVLGDLVADSPIYAAIRSRQLQEERDRRCSCASAMRRQKEACESVSRKLFTAFPHTHITPERI